MFEFIKKIFKEEKQIENIELSSIDPWFDNKANVVFYKINNEVTTLNIRLRSILIKVERELENLEKARLKNPNIPQKMIDIMKGNRESYIKKHKDFLNSLSMPKDYTDVDYFLDEIKNSLDGLHESTEKSYYVIHEFFEHESYKVASNIKKVDSLVDELKNSLSKYSLRKINKLQQDISNLKLKIKLEQEIKEKIKKLEEYSNDLNKANEKISSDINNFKETEEYKELDEKKKERDELLKKEEENNNKIFSFFSNIEHALKKYSRLSLEENLIKLYLENPIKALKSDSPFKIIEILKKMKDSIEKKKIELKDDKKDKTIENIETININFFNNFLEKYNELREKIKMKDKELMECKAIDKMKELYDKLNKSKENLKRLDENLDSLIKEYNKIDIDALKIELQDNLSNTFEASVVLK